MEKLACQRIVNAINENADFTERALEKCSAGTDEDYGLILDAQRYSLLDGGKRIRPFLVNECCALLGGDKEAAVYFAVAAEMVHTYSLIHDDLPCMDDDDLRRGKPSNHKKYGYANALLAGDALLTKAFGVIAEAPLSADARIEAVRILSESAGDRGMIAGQVMDLEGENGKLEFEKLLKLHSLKTGAMIECSVRLGCLAAGYDDSFSQTQALRRYARNIGLAFQVIDDVLDVIAEGEELGKATGSDAKQNKTTFMSYYTVDQAKEYAERLTVDAIDAISEINGSEILTDLACYLLERKK